MSKKNTKGNNNHNHQFTAVEQQFIDWIDALEMASSDLEFTVQTFKKRMNEKDMQNFGRALQELNKTKREFFRWFRKVSKS